MAAHDHSLKKCLYCRVTWQAAACKSVKRTMCGCALREAAFSFIGTAPHQYSFFNIFSCVMATMLAQSMLQNWLHLWPRACTVLAKSKYITIYSNCPLFRSLFSLPRPTWLLLPQRHLSTSR